MALTGGDLSAVAAAMQQNLFPQYTKMREQLEAEQKRMEAQVNFAQTRLKEIQTALGVLNEHPELERLLESMAKLNPQAPASLGQEQELVQKYYRLSVLRDGGAGMKK